MRKEDKKKLKSILKWLQYNHGRNLGNDRLVVPRDSFYEFVARNHGDREQLLRYIRRNYEGHDVIRVISIVQVLEREFNAKIVVNDKTGKIIIPKKGTWVRCYRCERTVKKDNSKHVVGHGDFCKPCHKEAFKKCDDCNKDIYEHDICHVNPYEENNPYGNKRKTLCHDCLRHYPKCHECDSRYFEEDIEEFVIYSRREGENVRTMCRSCFHNHYTTCSVCDVNIYSHSAHYTDEVSYCYRHIPARVINDWSYKPEPKFGRFPTEKTKLFYGIELEVDKGGNSKTKGKKIIKLSKDIYLKNDSSITSGFEIVSHPGTYRYHTEKLPWLKILEKTKELGYTSDNATCGIHIHVSKLWFGDLDSMRADENIAKLLTLTQKNLWDDVFKFTRRNERSMRQWARRYHNLYNPMDLLNEAKGGERHSSINLRNASTIEFRIFKGTLNYTNFIANIQLVRMFCEMAISLDERSIERTSWPDVIQYAKMCNYKEFLEYCKKLKMLK